MNEALFRYINATARHPWLDVAMPWICDKDHLLVPAIIIVPLAIAYGGGRQRLAVAAILIGVALSNTVCESVLKPAFGAKRPYATLEDVNLHRGGEWQVYDTSWYEYDERKSFAMPSSHAANAAAMAIILTLYNVRFAAFMFPFAIAVAYARIYTGNHYPGDVAVGFLIGTAIGAATWWGLKAFAKRLDWIGEPMSSWPEVTPTKKRYYGLAGAWVILNFIFLHLNFYDLAGDEAQYWDWSRRLDWSYYSKPPLIAYVMGFFSYLGGDEAWAIRTPALLATTGSVLLMADLANRILTNEKAKLAALVIAFGTPAIWAGSVMMTIDPLLIFCWSLATWALYRAVVDERRRWWIVVGIATGLGMMSKYTMALWLIGAAGFLLHRHRVALRLPGPWFALAIAIVLNGGVIYWNAANDWISFRHTAAIGAVESPTLLDRIGFVLAFFGGQAGVISPILWVVVIAAGVYALRRARNDDAAAFLAWSFWPLLAFYFIVSWTRPPNVNWPIAAYAMAGPLIAWWWYSQPRGIAWRRTLIAGLVLGISIGITTRVIPFAYETAGLFVDESDRRVELPFDPDRDPTTRLIGGQQLGAALDDAMTEHRRARFVFSDRYQLTASIAFYTDGHPRALCANIDGRRRNQYDLWNEWTEYKGRDGLFVTGGTPARARYFINRMVDLGAFDEGEVVARVPVHRGPFETKQYTICYMHSYSGYAWDNQAEGY